jgi:hypothetical protein
LDRCVCLYLGYHGLSKSDPVKGYIRLSMNTPSNGNDHASMTPDQDNSQSSPRGYFQWKIRTRISLAYHCKRLAQREGWETADRLRVLICLSATSRFLGLPENERFQEQVQLHRMTAKRGYSPRVGSSNTVHLSVRLPQGAAQLITMHASLTGQSRNELVIGLLQVGLVAYLRAENAFLKAVVSMSRSRNRIGSNTLD